MDTPTPTPELRRRAAARMTRANQVQVILSAHDAARMRALTDPSAHADLEALEQQLIALSEVSL